jgi:hypothetical protein
VFSHVVHPLGAAKKALGGFVQVNAGTISPAESSRQSTSVRSWPSRERQRKPQPRKESLMVVIRNVFRLKFGKAREAVALFKEGIAIQKRVGAGMDFSTRLLTDVTGPFYTVVLELTVPNLAAFEGAAPQLMGDKDWQANYQKIGSLVESGSREIFTLVE